MATSSSSSSTHHQNPHHLYGGATSAPPPTPSTQQPCISTTPDSATADTLSRLLHRLPPNLSLPTRLSPRTPPNNNPPTPLPTIALSSISFPTTTFEHGCFQLTHHSITSQLAESAESDSLSLFELPLDVKLSSFPTEWPLGFNTDDDDNDDHQTGSFCLDSQCSTTTTTTTTELRLASLRELTRELEKVGLEVVEKLACAVGFENPFREGGSVGSNNQSSSLMWVTSADGDKLRKVYPYVVGLQYQIRPKKWDSVSDSGLVCVEPQVGSVLVTLGDIAQVWSNGKLKKVKGRPAPVSKDVNSSMPCISMTMLITLPLETTVSPLLNIPSNNSTDHGNLEKDKEEDDDNDHQNRIDPSTSITNNGINDNEDYVEYQRVFNSFSFEDYAWRVYHERHHQFKDPLDRYRVIE